MNIKLVSCCFFLMLAGFTHAAKKPITAAMSSNIFLMFLFIMLTIIGFAFYAYSWLKKDTSIKIFPRKSEKQLAQSKNKKLTFPRPDAKNSKKTSPATVTIVITLYIITLLISLSPILFFGWCLLAG